MADTLGRRKAEQSGSLVGACARFYPSCCSYHEGWDDAMRVAAEFFLGEPEGNEAQPIAAPQSPDGSVGSEKGGQ